MTKDNNPRSISDRIKRFLKILLINYLVLEVVSLIGLGILKSFKLYYYPADTLDEFHIPRINRMIDDNYFYDTYSSETGWTIKPNGDNTVNPWHYKANSEGIRGDREYTNESPDSIIRISTFGDSFTHGDELSNNQTWQYSLQQEAPQLELINFGVGAFGTDQSYLRYRIKGKEYNSDIVTIGFMFENMLRNVNTYRPFYLPSTKKPLTKPRFKIIDDSMTLIPNPFDSLTEYSRLMYQPKEALEAMGEHDYFYQKRFKKSRWDISPIVRIVKLATHLYQTYVFYYISEDEMSDLEYYVLSERILREFYAEVEEDGSTPIIVFFPYKIDYLYYSLFKTKRYKQLYERLKSEGYHVIDLWDLFKDDGLTKKDIFNGKGQHYSAEANERIAGYLYDYLVQQELLDL